MSWFWGSKLVVSHQTEKKKPKGYINGQKIMQTQGVSTWLFQCSVIEVFMLIYCKTVWGIQMAPS